MHSNDAIEALTDAPVDPFNSQVVAAFSIAIKETRIPSTDKTTLLTVLVLTIVVAFLRAL